MKVQTDTTKQIELSISMNSDEAMSLKAILQNPRLHGPEKEDPVEHEVRSNIFHAIESAMSG